MGISDNRDRFNKSKGIRVFTLPHADVVFYVEDTTWGGIIKETHRLSPICSIQDSSQYLSTK